MQLIAVVGTSSEECLSLCDILEHDCYRAIPLHSLTELMETVRGGPCHAIILDLDSLPVDNSFVKTLRKLAPTVCIIAISSRTFHPELEEALRTNISACLSKPVQEDELIYWLKSICDDGRSARASPEVERGVTDFNGFAPRSNQRKDSKA